MEPKYAVYKNLDDEVLFCTVEADDVAFIMQEFGNTRVMIEVSPDCKLGVKYSDKDDDPEFESMMDAIRSYGEVCYFVEDENSLPTKRKTSTQTTSK